MKYLGGKFRIRKEVARFLESVRPSGATYLEPFVGAGWVLQEMSGKRIASDACAPLITMYKELQNGWIPPESLSKDVYLAIKKRMDHSDPITAFAGFGLSFGGKWFGGYASNGVGRNYCVNARNGLLKQVPMISGVEFTACDYGEHKPKGMLIYCDPPYTGTTGYSATGKFFHDRFWETMRKWSKDNIVVISEYCAPDDFQCVLEINARLDMHQNKSESSKRVERLFMLNDGLKPF